MKLAKLSLAALVAVGAFSVANATSLESAIKGVDVSGYVRYRYYNEDNSVPGHKTDRHRFTVPVLFKIPVAENITAAVGMFAQENDYASNTKFTGGGSQAYSDSSFNLSRMWFNYAANGWNVKLGRQLLKTPYTEGGITGSYGDGLVAMYSPMSNLTVAAAAFVKSNQTIDGAVGGVKVNNNNIYAAAAIGSFGGVNAQLWVFRVEQMVDDAEFLQLSGSIAGLSLKAQGSWTSLESNTYAALKAAGVVKDDSGAFYGIQAGYKIENFKLGAGYTTTDKDNGIGVLDADGGLIKAGKQIYYKTTNARDTDVYFFTVGAGYGKYSFGAGYVGASSVSGTTLDGANEIYGQVGYKFNKKFGVAAYYSALDMDKVSDNVAGGDNNEFRVEVKYSF